MKKRCLILASFLAATSYLLFNADTVRAARNMSSSPSPPQTGLEMPGEPNKGRKVAPIGAIPDAYGNVITGEEPEEKKAKKRLPPGAYGGYKEPERPLPDVKDERPVW